MNALPGFEGYFAAVNGPVVTGADTLDPQVWPVSKRTNERPGG
jgi:hypothetical protein